MSEEEKLNNVINRYKKYLDAQIRCYDRKIKRIAELRNQNKYLKDSERRKLKYECGRKDEVIKMKNHLIKLIEKEMRENNE